MALCTSGRGFRGNTCPTMTRRQAAHQALSLQSRPARRGTRNSQQASSARASSTPRFPRPPPWRLPQRAAPQYKYHNTAGKPRDRMKQPRILSPEKTITFQPTPARAGFSIFCQILTSSNMRQARLPRTHPIPNLEITSHKNGLASQAAAFLRAAPQRPT